MPRAILRMRDTANHAFSIAPLAPLGSFLSRINAVSPEQNPNFFPKQSERGLICAPRPLPAVAGAKTKNFPYLSFFLGGGCGGSRQKMERKFLVLLRRFSLRKEQSYFNIFVCSFLHPHGDRGAPVSAFGGSSNFREHTQPPSHSPLAFACAGCFGVVCGSLVGFERVRWQLKEMDCARAQTNLYVLAPPTQCAHKPVR